MDNNEQNKKKILQSAKQSSLNTLSCDAVRQLILLQKIGVTRFPLGLAYLLKHAITIENEQQMKKKQKQQMQKTYANMTLLPPSFVTAQRVKYIISRNN